MPGQRMHIGGVNRARWLAQLAEGLGIARKLAAQLDLSPTEAAEIAAVETRLVRLIAEVEALRRGGTWRTGDKFDPKPMNLRDAGPDRLANRPK